MSTLERKSITVSVDGKNIVFETGKVARQASGAVIVRCGDTIVFNSACGAAEASESANFFPLRVDYQEKFSSVGKTVSGFIKREGRPSEKETLVSRLIDRPLRPLFEDGYFNEVQVLSYVWSYDGLNSPEPLAICGASAALVISDIPLLKPVGAVRVGLVNNKFVINPTAPEQKESKLDLLIAGTEDAVLMIEGFCDFLSEEQVVEAIEQGHHWIKEICKALSGWQKQVGKPKNKAVLKKLPEELLTAVETLATPHLATVLRIAQKQKREEGQNQVRKLVFDTLVPEGVEGRFKSADVDAALKSVSSKMMRKMILEENLRSDGRNIAEIRPIDIEQGLLPRAHGSSLFTRGETQSVAVCTLGGDTMGQRFEDLHGEGLQTFLSPVFLPPLFSGRSRENGHRRTA